MYKNSPEQEQGKQVTYATISIERPGEQTQTCGTREYRLHEQDGQHERALPEIATLGLTKEKGAVASRGGPKEGRGNEQPANEIRETKEGRAKPCRLNQAKDTQDIPSPDEPGGRIGLGDEIECALGTLEISNKQSQSDGNEETTNDWRADAQQVVYRAAEISLQTIES